MIDLSLLAESALHNNKVPDKSLTHSERRQLLRVKATVAAERRLVGMDERCMDHDACRRLAFALWLYGTGRLSEAIDR